MSHPSTRTHVPTRTRAAALAAAGGVTLGALALGLAAPTEPGAPAIGRLRSAAAQPAPGATPSTVPPLIPTRLFGDEPFCSTLVRVDAPQAAVVGTRFVVSATAHVACANAFDGAAAVLLAGGTTAGSRHKFAAAVGAWAEAFDATDAVLAVVDVAAPEEPVRWAETPSDRRAALDAVRNRPADTAVDGAAWSAVFRTASAALAALPPTRRPLLAVIDGRRPTGSHRAGLTDLEAAAVAVHDAAGVTAVVDVSFDGWLADGARRMTVGGIVGLDGTVDPTPAMVEDGTRQLIARLRGVIDPALLQAFMDPAFVTVVPGSIAPPTDLNVLGLPEWAARSERGRVSLRGQVGIDAVRVGRIDLEFSALAIRDGVPVGIALDVRPLCIHAPGGSTADCLPTPRPTESRTPLPTATPPPTATATATGEPVPPTTATASATATPPPLRPVGRIWLPLGLRLDAGGA